MCWLWLVGEECEGVAAEVVVVVEVFVVVAEGD